MEGVFLPEIPKHPEVRTKIPSPFQRSRVDLDGTGRVKRDWQMRLVSRVAVGDTVAQFGTVAEVAETVTDVIRREGLTVPRVVPTWTVVLTNVLGQQRSFPGNESVHVFAAVDGAS